MSRSGQVRRVARIRSNFANPTATTCYQSSVFQAIAASDHLSEKIIEQAKERAGMEANNIVESAKKRIENEKKAALVEIKNTIATTAIEIAEKILREEFKDKKNYLIIFF